ncbi:hypothetical protein GQ53DRAFT_741511 [Thozetella sp. PMI_491]|nr:hypothetical protein GQ53DRAFT_741511 [Thozetella sp. PMI_491]
MRKQNIPVESSWRMVESGENDSFDTTIVRDEDEELIISSGSEPSQLTGSQPFSIGGSQPLSIGGSQDDNLENFLSKAELEDQVLLRSPFRPSVPQSVRQSSRETRKYQSPESLLIMPRLDHESPQRSSAHSSSTIRPNQSVPTAAWRRQVALQASPTKGPRRRARKPEAQDEKPPGFVERLSTSLPNTTYDMLAWFFGLIGLTFSYAQKPLAVALAIYLTFGGLIVARNMATRTIYESLSPICRLPGASLVTTSLGIPICPIDPIEDTAGGPRGSSLEFDGLMDIQDQFEQVLEKSAQGVSLPMEMKRSEQSIRDLRTIVRYSTLQSKEELVLEFEGFIETARTASNDLQKFNTHVGSAVDSVISINRWTSRYLDTLSDSAQESAGWLGAWTGWVFAPFQPTQFSERLLLDKYVEHTALVSDRIGDLILEAQAVLRVFGKAEDHLGIIYDFVTRTQKSVQGRKDEILWTIWTLVGANRQRLHNLNDQLALLREVNTQRTDAVRQVSELIVELEKIQAGLGDLRDRVAEPELARGRAHVPLSVHIETINRGVERLDLARSRIRAVENDRIREVLARGGKGDDRLIDS